ncbi:MAG TPA: inositol monophosphatase [Thermotogota bacterium]|nr:inositol monophosphatase [Thermotogota bacterium]HRW92469.1 inositol monophosphatase [Thermotogota bacterium]
MLSLSLPPFLQERFAFAMQILPRMGDWARHMQGQTFGVSFKKNDRDPVSDIDIQVQRMFQQELGKRFPQDSFMGEEEGFHDSFLQTSDGWILDPIDGTANFIHGLPLWAHSLAYFQEGKVQMGFVFAPAMDLFFSAIRGVGAWRNENAIRVSSVQSPASSQVATGISHLVSSADQDRIHELFLQAFPRFQRVRLFGSAALQLSFVASGWLEAFWQKELHPWDVAAGVLLVEEAHGKVSHFDGKPYSFQTGNIVASNAYLHPAILEFLSPVSL